MDGAKEGRKVPLKWLIQEGTLAQYVDRILLQPSDGMVMASFFQTDPPVNLTEEQRSSVEYVGTYCVARVVMSPAKAREFMDVFRRHLKDNHPDLPLGD